MRDIETYLELHRIYIEGNHSILVSYLPKRFMYITIMIFPLLFVAISSELLGVIKKASCNVLCLSLNLSQFVAAQKRAK
jgi:hypothetical protein